MVAIAVVEVAVPAVVVVPDQEVVAAADPVVAVPDLEVAADPQVVAADPQVVAADQVADTDQVITMDIVTDILVMLLPFTVVVEAAVGIGGLIHMITGGHLSGIPVVPSPVVPLTRFV